MANSNDSKGSQPSDQPAVSRAKEQVADLFSAADLLPRHAESINRVLETIARLNGVLASVSDRLGDTTFNATLDVTSGKSPREVSVGMVTHLAELASVSLRATNQLKQELDNARRAVAAIPPVAPRMIAALREVAGALDASPSSMPQAGPSTPVRPPAIVVETRVAVDPAQARPARAYDQTRSVGENNPPRARAASRRYMN